MLSTALNYTDSATCLETLKSRINPAEQANMPTLTDLPFEILDQIVLSLPKLDQPSAYLALARTARQLNEYAMSRFFVASEAAETKNAGFDVQTRGSCPYIG